MMWLSNKPEKQADIQDIVSKAYEWARLDETVHVIVWHNNPARGDISFPREFGAPKMVTIRHVSALSVEVPQMIRTLPCNISRKGENLADDLSAVLPSLLGDEAQETNIYIQCDLAKILMMYYQAQKYLEKGFMCADLTIRPHKVSELWAAYQADLKRSGIVMANMAFPRSREQCQTIIAENPRMREEGGTLLGATAPGFENSAFLADCRHTVMLSVMGSTLLRPLASGVINAVALNSDPECLFLLMKGSFFYLNLITRGDKCLSLVDSKDLFSVCGGDLTQQKTSWRGNGIFLQLQEEWESNVRTDEESFVRLQGSLLKKYKQENLLHAAVVETVLRGGFIQDTLTGELIMKSLCSDNEVYGAWAREQVLVGQNAQWYTVGDLKWLGVPIMDKHTLLTRGSHFSEQRPVGEL